MTVVSSGQTFVVSSGQTDNGDVVLSGGTEVVSLGGITNSALISGGTISVKSGGLASGTTFSSGGALLVTGSTTATIADNVGGELIQNGGVAVGTIVRGTGEQTVGFGATSATAIGTMVSSGGDVFVSSGGLLSGATISNGGQVFVQGGIASGTTLSGGAEYVSSGGTALDTTIGSGGTLTLFGTASGTVISSGGFEVISAGGVENDVTLLSGGTLAQFGGGTNNSLTWLGGTLQIGSGIVTGRSVSAGQELDVLFSGMAAGGTISTGGLLVVSSGGLATNETIDSGGNLYLDDGGNFSGGTLAAGANLVIESGATIELIGATTVDVLSSGTLIGNFTNNGANIVVSSGGSLGVSAGASPTGVVVGSGGFETVFAGGTAITTVVSAGGQLEFFDGAALSGAILQSGATLVLDSGATISTTDDGLNFAVLSGGVIPAGTIVNSGATIDVIGNNASLIFAGDNTFDNGTINIGSGAVRNSDPGGGAVLTFGANADVNHVSGTGYLTGDHNTGDAIVNSGTINSTAPAGTLNITPETFTNSGKIIVQNGSQLNIQPVDFTNYAGGTLTGGEYEIYSFSILELGFNQTVSTLAAYVLLADRGASLQAATDTVNVPLSQSLTTIDATGVLILDGDFGDTFTNDLTVNGFLSVQGDANASFNSLIVGSDQAFVQLGGNTRVFGDISMQGGAAIALDPTTDNFVEVIGNISESGGTRSLVVAGGGIVQLDGTNTFTGGITVNDSGTTLIISQDANLGDVAGGLTLTPGTTLEMAGGSSFAINHSIAVTGDATFRVDSAATVTITSMILGAGTVEVTGDFFSAGTLVLANANTYTGGTTIDFGTLEIAAMNAAGTGGITFAPLLDPTLKIDGAAFPANSTFTNVISGFGVGDDIELGFLGFVGAAGGERLTIDANNLLTVSVPGGSDFYSLQLAPSDDFSYDVFYISSAKDGSIDIAVTSSLLVSGVHQPISFAGTVDSPIVFNGAIVDVLDGFAALAAQIEHGGQLWINSGGFASSTIIDSGGLVVVSDSGTVSSTLIESGGALIVSSGGIANSGTVFGDAGVYGSAVGDTVSAGGTEIIFGAASAITVDGGRLDVVGTADNTTVGRGEIVIFDGGTGFFTSVTGTAPGSGGIETVFAGGFAFATTLDGDGAQQFVYGFGSSTSVNSGGSLIVGAGGSATRAQVFQSGSLDVQGGGIALSASIYFSGHGSVELAGTAITTSLGGGATFDVYGTASDTRIGANALEQVFAGGVDNGAQIVGEQDVYGSATGAFVTSTMIFQEFGPPLVILGQEVVKSGGVTGGTFVFGGSQTIEAGGSDVDAMVGGTQTVFGTASSATIGTPTLPGAQFVGAGGIASGTIVTSVGYMEVDSGGTGIDAIIAVGGSQVVSAGGSDFNATVAGQQDVFGFVSAATILPFGVQTVEVGGLAVGTVVDATAIEYGSYGVQDVFGSAVGTQVQSGDFQAIESGGYSLGTTVSSGGQEIVSAGGLTSGTTLLSGGFLDLFGTGNGTFITAGASETVESGGTEIGTGVGGVESVAGTASGAVVLAGGLLNVSQGGTTLNTGVRAGGVEYVSAGGSAGGTVVSAGGTQIVSGQFVVPDGPPPFVLAGVASGTTLISGVQTVDSFGIASNTVLLGVGAQHVLANGLAIGTVVNGGGTQTVSAGGLTSGTILAAAAVQFVFGSAVTTLVSAGDTQLLGSGGTAVSTTVSSGGLLLVGSGGLASGATVSNGGNEVVSSGGSASGTAVLSGGSEVVSAGALAAGTFVAGGVEIVLAQGSDVGALIGAGGIEFDFGTASGTVISNGGTLLVGSGGVASGTIVRSGGTLELESGGTLVGQRFDPGGIFLANGVDLSGTVVGSGMEFRVGHGSIARGAIVGNGGRLRATAGATAIGTQVGSGGQLLLDSGGVASGTMIGFGGSETVAFGGTDVDAVVSGGFQDIAGTALNSFLLAGGIQMIESGGVTSGTVLDDNDLQFVYGFASGTVVSATDTQVVEPGGFAANTVVSSGGGELVLSGGTSFAATVLSGGAEVVQAGGADFSAVINGGAQDVSGTVSGTLVTAGGVQTVEAGGIASSTVLQTTALQIVYGTASATTISAGDVELVQSGGLAVNPVIAGGLLELAPAGNASGSVVFAGSGTLRIDGTNVAAVVPIGGFSTGDIIDLPNVPADAAVYANGTLTLLNGATPVAQLSVFTPFTNPGFSLTPDGVGGTLITVGPAVIPPPTPIPPPPTPIPPPPTSLFDFLYRYNDGQDYYYGMVADNGTFGYQTGQQLATAIGSYTIFNQESGTTGAPPGSVFVTYYSHAGVGAASTTPFNFAHNLVSGIGGLGTELDLMLGTDGQYYQFNSNFEMAIPTSSLFGFVFTYADGSAYYTGTVSDDGSYGYGSIADSSGTKMVFDSSGKLEGYYTIYREGGTALPSGMVTINRLFSGQTGLAYAPDPGKSGGGGGLSSELGFVTINGVQLVFGDPPEPVLPAFGTDVVSPASPVVATGSGQFIGTGDFANSGQAGLLSVSGGNAAVALAGDAGFSARSVSNAHMGAEWAPVGTGDFNHDGESDILWANGSGQVTIWQMNGSQLLGVATPAGGMGAEWHVAGAGDFNADGNTDILWQSNLGNLAVWSMSGTALGGFGIPNGQMGAEWRADAVGDFTGDGRSDALWVSNSGQVSIWTLSGSDLTGFYGDVGRMGPEWRVAGVGNFNGDSTSDIVWVNGNNDVQIWAMAGGAIGQIVSPAGHEGSEWHLGGVADLTGDHIADLLWVNNNGASHIWQVNGTQVTVGQGTAPASASSAAGLAADPGFAPVPVTDGDLILTAQPGPEEFDFSSWSFGHDSIQNFAPGEDVIGLSQNLAGDFASLQRHISSAGTATVISLDPSRSLTLDHVSPATLSAANFRFV